MLLLHGRHSGNRDSRGKHSNTNNFNIPFARHRHACALQIPLPLKEEN